MDDERTQAGCRDQHAVATPRVRSRHGRRRGGRRLADDRGDTSIFVAFALAVVGFYFVVHAALVFHGRSVVAAAAQDALAATQREDGTVGDGRAAAHRTVALSPGLRNVRIDVRINSSNTEVRVEVSAEVENVLVDMKTDVSAVAVGPRERFYTETERP